MKAISNRYRSYGGLFTCGIVQWEEYTAFALKIEGYASKLNMVKNIGIDIQYQYLSKFN
jgi:hypothetical protein